MLQAYQILQVAPWASRDQVKRAYREKVKQHHPDAHRLGPGDPDRMARLNDALELVSSRA